MKFSKKYFNINAPLFIALIQLPTIILSVILRLITEFNPELFSALQNIESKDFDSGTAALYTSVVLFFTIISCLISNSRKKRKMNNSQMECNTLYNSNFNNNNFNNNNFNNSNLNNNGFNNNNFNNNHLSDNNFINHNN